MTNRRNAGSYVATLYDMHAVSRLYSSNTADGRIRTSARAFLAGRLLANSRARMPFARLFDQ